MIDDPLCQTLEEVIGKVTVELDENRKGKTILLAQDALDLYDIFKAMLFATAVTGLRNPYERLMEDTIKTIRHQDTRELLDEFVFSNKLATKLAESAEDLLLFLSKDFPVHWILFYFIADAIEEHEYQREDEIYEDEIAELARRASRDQPWGGWFTRDTAEKLANDLKPEDVEPCPSESWMQLTMEFERIKILLKVYGHLLTDRQIAYINDYYDKIAHVGSLDNIVPNRNVSGLSLTHLSLDERRKLREKRKKLWQTISQAEIFLRSFQVE